MEEKDDPTRQEISFTQFHKLFPEGKYYDYDKVKSFIRYDPIKDSVFVPEELTPQLNSTEALVIASMASALMKRKLEDGDNFLLLYIQNHGVIDMSLYSLIQSRGREIPFVSRLLGSIQDFCKSRSLGDQWVKYNALFHFSVYLKAALVENEDLRSDFIKTIHSELLNASQDDEQINLIHLGLTSIWEGSQSRSQTTQEKTQEFMLNTLNLLMESKLNRGVRNDLLWRIESLFKVAQDKKISARQLFRTISLYLIMGYRNPDLLAWLKEEDLGKDLYAYAEPLTQVHNATNHLEIIRGICDNIGLRRKLDLDPNPTDFESSQIATHVRHYLEDDTVSLKDRCSSFLWATKAFPMDSYISFFLKTALGVDDYETQAAIFEATMKGFEQRESIPGELGILVLRLAGQISTNP